MYCVYILTLTHSKFRWGMTWHIILLMAEKPNSLCFKISIHHRVCVCICKWKNCQWKTIMWSLWLLLKIAKSLEIKVFGSIQRGLTRTIFFFFFYLNQFWLLTRFNALKRILATPTNTKRNAWRSYFNGRREKRRHPSTLLLSRWRKWLSDLYNL